MPSENTEQRKLAAIMFTDMVGYSALAQRNEALALELLEEHRRVVRALLPRHNGREVKTTGDGFLLEFPSALAAVQGAVEIQNALHERNQVNPLERQIRIRIGIHVGDVVMREGDIHGDGVNIAARIEPLAPSGGICVSNAVFEQVRNKLEQGFASLGPAELKNIELPVAVHRVVMPWEDAGSAALPKTKVRRKGMAWALSVILVLGIGILILVILKRPTPSSAPADGTTAQSPANALVANARALLDDDPLMTRANVELAEQLSLEAIAKEPANAEAYAIAAWANFQFLNDNYEDTPQRRTDLKNYSDKARLLAPTSVNAELAVCGMLIVTQAKEEAIQRLKALAARAPENSAVLRTWAWASLWGKGADWGAEGKAEPQVLSKLRELSPLGRAYADTYVAARHWGLGEYAEADRLLDAVFVGGHPVRESYLIRLLVLAYGWGDLPAAQNFVATMPAKLLLEDVFITHASSVWLYSSNYDQTLATLARTQRPMLHEARIEVPTALLRGLAHDAAGRPQAAALQWREALKVVQQLLESQPDNLQLHENKASILALLGEPVAATGEYTLVAEMEHPVDGSVAWGQSYEFFVVKGEVDAAVQRLDRVIARDNPRWPTSYNHVRYDYRFAQFRLDPRVQVIMARAEGWLDEMRRGKTTATSNNPTPTPASSAPPVDQKSVAVLAFANLSEDKANEYFSDGISEELLNVLAKVPGLKVTARTSSFHFKGKDTPVPEIARQLGVAYVVEGSVRKSGDKVRITAQLIKAADGFHVWSDTFTRDLKDIFAVQDEIAGLVAQNLSLKLGAANPGVPIDPEAFRLYLEGRKEWSLRTKPSLAGAESLFTQAIALDPKFARAYAGVADVWMIRADVLERENKNADAEYVHTSEAVDRALQLDPDLAEAHATRGNYFIHKEQFVEAQQAFKRAIALNPNYASARQWYGRLLFTLGNLDAGLAQLELATQLDPLSPIITSNYGMFLGFARRWSESLAACDRVLAIQPEFMQALGSRAHALINLDRKSEALALMRANFKFLGSNAPPDPNGDFYSLILLGMAGDRANAERLAAPILAGQGGNSPTDVFSLYLALNRIGEAFAYLEKNQVRFKRSDLTYILDPVYDPVRDDARFLHKLDEAGLLATYKDVWAQYLAWKQKSAQP